VQRPFSPGYLLVRHLPALDQQIASGFKEAKHPYAEGFVAGSQQFEKEKVVVRRPPPWIVCGKILDPEGLVDPVEKKASTKGLKRFLTDGLPQQCSIFYRNWVRDCKYSYVL
jgi:hypothetical protein